MDFHFFFFGSDYASMDLISHIIGKVTKFIFRNVRLHLVTKFSKDFLPISIEDLKYPHLAM